VDDVDDAVNRGAVAGGDGPGVGGGHGGVVVWWWIVVASYQVAIAVRFHVFVAVQT
jgi:hypothetical protein